MLKSNSKFTKEKIKEYILNCWEEYEFKDELEDIPQDFAGICKTICEIVKDEKLPKNPQNRRSYLIMYYHNNYYEMFENWTRGLPALLDCCYWLYYLLDPREVIKQWLQETEEEAAKYTEEQAAILITKLLYREIFRFN